MKHSARMGNGRIGSKHKKTRKREEGDTWDRGEAGKEAALNSVPV